MANSKLPGIQLNPPGPFAPARTFGPLGLNDQGDPGKLTLLGDTPGALGFNDWADPNLKTWTPGSGFNFSQSVRTDTGVALSLPVGGAGTLVDDSLGRLITKEQLKKFLGSASLDYLSKLADELNRDLVKYCLNTVLRRAHFFAQVREESGSDLQTTAENLQYRHEVLVKKFSYYQRHPTEALADGSQRDPASGKLVQSANPETIANKAYQKKYGNRDAASGDGWRYRGRGSIQITFLSNYEETTSRYKKVYGEYNIDFVNNPELMAQFPYSIRSAVCYWLNKKLYKLADNGSDPNTVDTISKVVNNSPDSLSNRRIHFFKALYAFS